MKIIPSEKACADLIIGVYGSTNFYENFDRRVYIQAKTYSSESLKNDNSLDEIYELLTKIQSHWNKTNRKAFHKLIKDNYDLFGEFIRRPRQHYKALIKSINLKGIQNTKISKFLYILKPKIIPMIDPEQGKLLIKKYNRTSRSDLIAAIETLHNHLKKNSEKVKGINYRLSDHGINISDLRTMELLIWLQTQFFNKEIKKEIIRT